MKVKFDNMKTPRTKHCMRFTDSFPINLPAEKIDLIKWVTEFTNKDYRSYSKSHLAMASYFEAGKFHMINVENIGNETIVQGYELLFQSPNHVQFYSPKSLVYVFRWFPAQVGVPWELIVKPTSATTSELICLIGADFSTLFLKIAAWFNGLGGYFLKKHLKIEGKNFAIDIETKFEAF